MQLSYLPLVKQQSAVSIRHQLLAMQHCRINMILHGLYLQSLGSYYMHFCIHAYLLSHHTVVWEILSLLCVILFVCLYGYGFLSVGKR